MTGIDPGPSLRVGTPADADAIEAISTGHIAGKRSFIVDSLQHRCVVTAWVDDRVGGYVIWDRLFFGRPFVWLLGVDPVLRRRGIAARLMREFERQCHGESLFTSTNESNLAMQAVLDGLGYVRCGRVEQIDPGDPELFYFKRTV